jgi:hypothetical protein
MDVRFVTPDLRRLDALHHEALAVGIFEDERPVRGPLGLVDWRMCGSISRMLLSGRLRGTRGERLLLPPGRRLSFDKLLIFGLGPRADFDTATYDATVDDILRTLSGVRVRAPVVALPGRSADRIAADQAMERFLVIAAGHGEHDEVTLIEDAEAQRVMAPLVERARRRARADQTQGA